MRHFGRFCWVLLSGLVHAMLLPFAIVAYVVVSVILALIETWQETR